MNKELEMIRILKLSPVENKSKCKEEAKRVVKKYFSSDWSDRWEILTYTYRENLKINKEKWVEIAKESPEPKFKIRSVNIQSGCLAVVTGNLLLGEDIRQIKIGLVKEAAPYQPDPDSKYQVVGTTVPPYIAV